jgi:hypothetical protein
MSAARLCQKSTVGAKAASASPPSMGIYASVPSNPAGMLTASLATNSLR